MLKSLIWKDFRQSSEVFFAGGLLLLGPYVTVWVIMYVYGPTPFPWSQTAAYGSLASQWCALLTCALVGGNAVASEREDGSIKFLRALPVRPSQILSSKVAVVVFYLPWLWALNLIVYSLAMGSDAVVSDSIVVNSNLLEIAASAFFVLSIAWLAAGRLNSPVGAAMASIAALGLLHYARYVILGRLPWEDSGASSSLFVSILIGTGLIAFTVGSVHFFKAED